MHASLIDKSSPYLCKKKYQMNHLTTQQIEDKLKHIAVACPAHIISEDNEVNPAMMFMLVYEELFFLREVPYRIKTNKFLKAIMEKEGIGPEHIASMEMYSLKAFKMSRPPRPSSYIILLHDSILLQIRHKTLTIYYGRKTDESRLNQLLDFASGFKKKESKGHENKFYMVSKGDFMSGFDLKPFPIQKIEIDLNAHYNDDFLPVHNTIAEFINRKNANGLVLLHGKFGTGKTTYIRHLISQSKERIIYLPLHLMSVLSDPDFLPFISDYRDSVLVLEDCEELLKPRVLSDSTNHSLVNLLNLGDGLLSDALSIKVICTFNAMLKDIDQAILRKGRLVARYEFGPLSSEKTHALLVKQGVEAPNGDALTLAEIYNMSSPDYSLNGVQRKLGFGNHN